MITTDEYMRAERDVTLREWRRGWRVHALVYVVVNTGLAALNVALVTATDASFIWFPFPLVGWGIGLTLHYLHGVRRADRTLRRRQLAIEEHAEATRRAA